MNKAYLKFHIVNHLQMSATVPAPASHMGRSRRPHGRATGPSPRHPRGRATGPSTAPPGQGAPQAADPAAAERRRLWEDKTVKDAQRSKLVLAETHQLPSSLDIKSDQTKKQENKLSENNVPVSKVPIEKSTKAAAQLNVGLQIELSTKIVENNDGRRKQFFEQLPTYDEEMKRTSALQAGGVRQAGGTMGQDNDHRKVNEEALEYERKFAEATRQRQLRQFGGALHLSAGDLPYTAVETVGELKARSVDEAERRPGRHTGDEAADQARKREEELERERLREEERLERKRKEEERQREEERRRGEDMRSRGENRRTQI